MVFDLSVQAFNPSHVRDEPLTCPGQSVREGKAQKYRSEINNKPPFRRYETEHNVDLLIRDLLQICTDSIHNMHVVNTDALSDQNKSP